MNSHDGKFTDLPDSLFVNVMSRHIYITCIIPAPGFLHPCSSYNLYFDWTTFAFSIYLFSPKALVWSCLSFFIFIFITPWIEFHMCLLNPYCRGVREAGLNELQLAPKFHLTWLSPIKNQINLVFRDGWLNLLFVLDIFRTHWIYIFICFHQQITKILPCQLSTYVADTTISLNGYTFGGIIS